MQHSGQRVTDLSWPQLEQQVSGHHWSLLPIGAGSKAHGAHLPLNTDQLQVEWLCGELMRQLPVLVWPTVNYGHYPAFVDYPGHTSLSEATFQALLDNICTEILQQGPPGIVLVNSGISTMPSVDRIASSSNRIHALHIYAQPGFGQCRKSISGQTGGGHADEVETSIMLHLYPQRVDMQTCLDESSTSFGPGKLNRFHPHQANYSATGAMGNPTLATAEKGQRLCSAMLNDARQYLSTLMDTTE